MSEIQYARWRDIPGGIVRLGVALTLIAVVMAITAARAIRRLFPA